MLVIDTALAACEEVVVISYTKPAFDRCDVTERAVWFAALYPQVRLLIVDDAMLAAAGFARRVPANDAPDAVQRDFCGWLCWEVLGMTVDAVFTSESYGDGFALALARYFAHRSAGFAGVAHVNVDQARHAVPISGTMLRGDPHANRRFLHPDVYASFVQRACILGGESSGKTTLARALARHLGTVWVPEYGRTLWERQGGVLAFGDMLHIGVTQAAHETALAAQADRWLVCDTGALVTAFYSEVMFGKVDPALVALFRQPYGATFVCAPDFAFVQDGTRRDQAFRQRQHVWYCEALDRRGIPYTLLSGPLDDRIGQAALVLAHGM